MLILSAPRNRKGIKEELSAGTQREKCRAYKSIHGNLLLMLLSCSD